MYLVLAAATREGAVRRDGESEADDDVGDGHVDQVHPGVHPELAGSFDNNYEILVLGSSLT